MIRLLIILGIVVFLMRAFFRLMYPRLPEQTGPKVQQILSCDYCGRLVAEDGALHLPQRLGADLVEFGGNVGEGAAHGADASPPRPQAKASKPLT